MSVCSGCACRSHERCGPQPIGGLRVAGIWISHSSCFGLQVGSPWTTEAFSIWKGSGERSPALLHTADLGVALQSVLCRLPACQTGCFTHSGSFFRRDSAA